MFIKNLVEQMKLEIAAEEMIEDKYMNFNSTGTDDMDYYIWQPAE